MSFSSRDALHEKCENRPNFEKWGKKNREILKISGQKSKKSQKKSHIVKKSILNHESTRKWVKKNGWVFHLETHCSKNVKKIEKSTDGAGRRGEKKKRKKSTPEKNIFENFAKANAHWPNPTACKKKKEKQIVETTAESQGIVAQGNSNPYNTVSCLSRLQMIQPPPCLADVEPPERDTAATALNKSRVS